MSQYVPCVPIWCPISKGEGHIERRNMGDTWGTLRGGTWGYILSQKILKGKKGGLLKKI
jgi:hypothetical protein